MNKDHILNNESENQRYTELLPDSTNDLDKQGQNVSSQNEIQKDKNQFEKYSPLRTLFHFSVGPLMFNTGISFQSNIKNKKKKIDVFSNNINFSLICFLLSTIISF